MDLATDRKIINSGHRGPFAPILSPMVEDTAMDNRSSAEHLKCTICRKTFSKSRESSLVRHSKRCTDEPRPSLRQKSCKQCASTKSKCDLRRPDCERCISRKITCEYPVPASLPERIKPRTNHAEISHPRDSIHDALTINFDAPEFSAFEQFLSAPDPLDDGRLSFLDGTSSTSNLALSMLDESDITNRSSLSSPSLGSLGDGWHLPLYPDPSSTPPLTKHSMEYIFRVLRTWPCMMARDMNLPPVIHPYHILQQPLPLPLANCFTLTKMWYGQNEASSLIVRNTIIKEMQSILKTYVYYDEANAVAGLQALAIYLIMILFPSKSDSALPCVDQSIFYELQHIVYYFVNLGLVLPEERNHTCPKWEDWIHMNAKRRAVLTLYLIHWSYSVYHCLPSFACEELGFMPAPAAKMLWQANDKDQWEYLYTRWLNSWQDCGYLQGELAMIKEGVKVDPRTEMWLEEADEFGIMFMSIVNAADREPIFDGAASIKF